MELTDITYRGPIDDEEIRWDVAPHFEFATEVAALTTLAELGDHLTNARRQIDEIMRYLRAAIPAAHSNGEGETSVQAIIGHSGLSRRTVYQILSAAQTDDE